MIEKVVVNLKHWFEYQISIELGCQLLFGSIKLKACMDCGIGQTYSRPSADICVVNHIYDLVVGVYTT